MEKVNDVTWDVTCQIDTTALCLYSEDNEEIILTAFIRDGEVEITSISEDLDKSTVIAFVKETLGNLSITNCGLQHSEVSFDEASGGSLQTDASRSNND